MPKRSFDFIAASAALFFLSPVILFVCCFVRVFLGSPVFFCQKRPGLNGRSFVMYKFRSMLDVPGLSDADRLNRAGKLLRATSLDELPELWNVIKGDMSLVGPRPLLAEYLPLYSREQSRRHEVRPGITGWAQINGRNAISWEDKFALDVWYVDNQSLWLDLKILFLTVKKVLIRDGISAAGEATMPKFTGSQS